MNGFTFEEMKDKIFHQDCIEGMKMIPDGSVDCIICDLPYGNMKGINEKFDWDVIIPTDKLFEQYEQVLRQNGTIIIFSQEPYTSHLRSSKLHSICFLYPMIWKKNGPGHCLSASKAPVSLFEDINVFRKIADSANVHPLRKEAQKIRDYIGKSFSSIEKELASMGKEKPYELHHFSPQKEHTYFRLCSELTYNYLIEVYGIDKMQGFLNYEKLLEIKEDYKSKIPVIFNLPEGAKSLSNVLEFPKDTDGFHPTQKPVNLLRRIIATYSNEGDTILDNCMGSGTTAIAAIREKRHFIGFELNKEYYDKACQRIKREQQQQQLTLF